MPPSALRPGEPGGGNRRKEPAAVFSLKRLYGQAERVPRLSGQGRYRIPQGLQAPVPFPAPAEEDQPAEDSAYGRRSQRRFVRIADKAPAPCRSGEL
jgi:hypothetical protein